MHHVPYAAREVRLIWVEVAKQLRLDAVVEGWGREEGYNGISRLDESSGEIREGTRMA